MDIRMPVMDGYEAARRIRASTQRQVTTIIALTASTSEQTSIALLSGGFDDYIKKPVIISELLAKIAHHLGVQYHYQEVENGKSDVSSYPAEEIVQTQTEIRKLPKSWVSDLHLLAVKADSKRMLSKIDEIQDEHPQLAAALTSLVKKFRLETILSLTSLSAEQEQS
jgi:DNA-binding response OmpR family regulator